MSESVGVERCAQRNAERERPSPLNWLAMGGGALSNYLAVGGVAISKKLAIGGSAFGNVAIGREEANGIFSFLRGQEYNMEIVWNLVKQQFPHPHMWGWVKGVIQWVLD